MSKVKLKYTESFVADVLRSFPENEAIRTAVTNNKYSVGNHLEIALENTKVTSDELISCLELGIPSKEELERKETQYKKINGLYIRWVTFIEATLDEEERSRDREQVSPESSNK